MNISQLDHPLKLSRGTDPDTSFDAGCKASRFAATHRDLIHRALLTHGPMQYEQIADVLEMEPVAVGRRLGELKAAARVIVTGKAKTSSGCNASVFEAVA